MSTLRLSEGSDATWARAWVVTTTAERTALLATHGTPLGPKRGDMILDNETGQLYLVTNSGAVAQITGNATLPIDLTTDVSGILPIANGGTGNNNFYEEGTWLPNLKFGGGNTGMTYTAQFGHWTRIGRLVCATGLIVLLNKGSSTGAAVIEDLPFDVMNQGSSAAGANFDLMGAAVNNLVLSCIQNTATMFPFTTIAGATIQLADTDYNNNSVNVLQATYQTDEWP